jgi:pyridoxine 5-phosphate synthase
MAEMRLGVNVDHTATLRQARGGAEPNPVHAALQAELAGATSIVMHLREDRRHIQDEDVRLARRLLRVSLNLEMALNEDIVSVALEVRPAQATIVPEKRKELTTEGGLELTGLSQEALGLLERLKDAGIRTFAFIEPDLAQILRAKELGLAGVELHTGRYANHTLSMDAWQGERARIEAAAQKAHALGLVVAAGHGLNYQNVRPIVKIPSVEELNIGHSIISRSVFVGIFQATRDMLSLTQR